MKYLRWLLAAAIAFYTLMTLYVMGLTVLFKLGQLTNVPPEEQRFIALMEGTPWYHIGLWAAVVALYLAAAWRLVRGGKALGLFAGAFVLDMAGLVLMRGNAVYQQTFTAQELALDYYIAASLVVGGLLIWWTERAARPTAAAA